jgi:pimeloyl-ACP methyl ester carboxylesterase
MSAPWGFAPEDIAIPVHVFQGEADALVPATWGRGLAPRVPGAGITCYPDEGHFIALTRRRDVLEYLVGDRR